MEYIVLQPLQTNNDKLNVSIIQRKEEITADEERLILHEAAGPFAGFIVKKMLPIPLQARYLGNFEQSDLSFKLNTFMRHATSPSAEYIQEQRTLQFWFAPVTERDRMNYSNSFFHNLFKGDNFPKDYFNFLLRVMQIFKALKPIMQLRVEIENIGSSSTDHHLSILNGSQSNKTDPKEYAAMITGKVLEFLERAFPNTISVDELSKLVEADKELVFDFLRDLLSRGLVKQYDNGNSWIRNIVNLQEEQTHEVIMIKQQLTVANDDQPSIAIITVNYYEKLAVDAMMTNKVTFVRHRPEAKSANAGESNVYTIGSIGEHRVVSTKLPLQVGRDSLSVKISSGNTTTRLLGIFQRVEHVFLIGCAGGVAHYADHARHLRRGDVVVSFPESLDPQLQSDSIDQNFVYAHFETQKATGGDVVAHKAWMPASMDLYKIVNSIRKVYDARSNKKYAWEEYLSEAIATLTDQEIDWSRPKREDKLFFAVGAGRMIEVDHPVDNTEGATDRRAYGLPVIRFGKIGGGKSVSLDESLRQAVSEQYGVACFDSDLDQVMESIDGNRKDSFILIRGITDYADGTTNKEWQPYASLCAASFAKAIICALPVNYDN